MTREEKCKLAIERGYTYNPETGLIYNKFKKIIKSRKCDGYVQIHTRKNGLRIGLLGHQFAWYYINKECVEQIDHINGIKDDNRIYNLRSVSHNQNQWNRLTAKGYSYVKRDNKYQSQIRVNNRRISLGAYNTEQEARNAYLAAKEIYHKF